MNDKLDISLRKIVIAAGISALTSFLDFRDDVWSHLNYNQLFSEILKYELI